jgi:hypothetical protein
VIGTVRALLAALLLAALPAAAQSPRFQSLTVTGQTTLGAATGVTLSSSDTSTGLATMAAAQSIGAAVRAAAIPAATGALLGGSGAAGTASAVTVGTGLTLSSGTLSVAYGTTAGTAAQGNDSRITGALSAATAASTYAPLASPALTGNPTAPTQSPGDNSTRLATTAFVVAAGGGSVNGGTAVTFDTSGTILAGNFAFYKSNAAVAVNSGESISATVLLKRAANTSVGIALIRPADGTAYFFADQGDNQGVTYAGTGPTTRTPLIAGGLGQMAGTNWIPFSLTLIPNAASDNVVRYSVPNQNNQINNTQLNLLTGTWYWGVTVVSTSDIGTGAYWRGPFPTP